MDMSSSFSLQQLMANSVLLITVLLTLGIIRVNGIMDIPGAIATCASARSLDVNVAIVMAAVCNCAGTIVMTMINATVASAITNMVNFGDDTLIALIVLRATLFLIVVWSSFAASISYSTSGSHTSIADPTGVAMAIHDGFSAINASERMKMVYDLVFFVILGFSSGYLSCKLVSWTCRNMDRCRTIGFFRYTQIAGVAAMAFMRGVQNEQEFAGVMFLGICMVSGNSSTVGIEFLLWMLLLGSAAMAPRTPIDEKKIIKSMRMDIVRLEECQDFSADMVGAACPLGFSTSGIPVSTTHTKTIAIMGMGAVKRLPTINFNVVKGMVMTWVMTFPGYGIIGFFIAKLFMILFHG